MSSVYLDDRLDNTKQPTRRRSKRLSAEEADNALDKRSETMRPHRTALGDISNSLRTGNGQGNNSKGLKLRKTNDGGISGLEDKDGVTTRSRSKQRVRDDRKYT